LKSPGPPSGGTDPRETTMSKVKLAPGLEFDAAELATEVTAAIGIRGSGKSNALGVLAEGMLDAGIQVAILDPVGLWFSLRLQADGKTPSRHKIHVLGGRHGDIPLLPTSGRLVARALASTRASAVLDVSQMSKGDRCRFAADLAETLLHEKKEHQSPLWLALEEAQTFAPQVIRHGLEYMGRMLGAFEEMAEVGRNFGLGLGLASQRPQKVNKEVLNLAENVLAFRLLGALERKAVRDWVQEKDAAGRENVDGELPALPKGTALAWSPVRGVFGRFPLAKKKTYDAGATPLAARVSVKVGALDLGLLATAMQEVVEEAARNDAGKLRARIADLERQLSEGRFGVPVPRPFVPSYLLESSKAASGVIDVCAQDLFAASRALNDAMGKVASRMIAAGAGLTTALGKAQRAEVAQEQRAGEDAPTPTAGARRAPAKDGASERASEGQAVVIRLSDHVKLRPAARAMLEAFALTMKPGLTWRQAALLAGRKPRGGAFDEDVRTLLREDLVGGISRPPSDPPLLSITQRGRDAVGLQPMQGDPKRLLEMWATNLPSTAHRMVAFMVEEYERGEANYWSWERVALSAGLVGARGGNFDNLRRTLRDCGLVEEAGDGNVRLAEELRS
jgi:hypothetical protein